MSTKGLFIPLSVVKGDSLAVAFDISLDGQMVDPSTITLEGQFVRNYTDMNVSGITLASTFAGNEDLYPESFTFVVSENDPNKVYANISAETSDGLMVGEYTYQIRFTHNSDLSASRDSTGDKTTILYGSLTVLDSPLFI